MFSALPHAFYYVFFPLLFYVGKRRLLFYTVKARDGLNRYRKRIDLLNYTVLTKDERLVVTTMLLDKFTMGYF